MAGYEKREDFQVPTDSKDPKDLITWAQKKVDCGYAIPERQAKENLAFFQGDQWGVWNPDRKRFDNPRQHRGDANAPVRMKVNKIASIGERVIARLLKSSPIPECRPVTDTLADVNSAKVGTRMLDHEFTRLEINQMLLELYFWVVPLGWSFLHPRWDPEAGDPIGVDPETGEAVTQGEIVLEEVPAFELRLDPNARRFRQAQWCTRTVAMTKEAIFEQYGKTPDGADGTDAISSEWRSGDSTETTGSSKTGQFVAVHQLWLRPGRANPKGLVMTWCGNTLLEDPMDYPYAHGKLPFVPFNLLPALGGGAAGRTWVTDLIAMQRDYNDARSREAAIRRVMTPKVLAARGQIDAQRLTSRVEVIDYNPTGPEPKWMHMDPSWMAQYEQAMQRADMEMGDRAGQGDVTSGKAATSAPAASILALQEADESKLAISAKELSFSIQNLGWQLLMLIKQFWDEDRVVRTWSRDGTLEVSHFSKSDLGNQLDVHVSSESALPRSKAARTQLAIDLHSGGMLGAGPEANKNFLRLLDLPGTDFLVETLNLDSKQAEREHGHILNLEPVVVEWWHNHAEHMPSHMDFMKTEEFEQLEDVQKEAFLAHLRSHLQMALAQIPADPSAAPTGEPAPGGGNENPSGDNGEYMDPMTGKPQDPLAVAAGQAPSALQGSKVQASQGVIGGAGNPGPVPGQSNDTTAYRTGN